MFARSTACRQGEGRTSSPDTSITWIRPRTTSRFAGLMSRCARPASQSLRIRARPSSMT
jgi:hypothetical protein